MTCALLKKLVRLGRDEDGAALVVTLALFMFMYLSCAGVFVVGQQVKDRIHLQNACDAAAYSAAVVQADTLSRIATINRAMAWTYISMTHRQVDYILNKWLKESIDKYEEDWNKSYGGRIGIEMLTDLPVNNKMIKLNDEHEPYWYVKSVQASFSGHLAGQSPSFYSNSDLAEQINDDKRTISDMNKKEEQLLKGMRKRIEAAVNGVLDANVPSEDVRSRCLKFFNYDETASGDDEIPSYVVVKDSSAEDEFAGFANASLDIAGASKWFVSAGVSDGYKRNYKSSAGKPLYSRWWYAVEEGVGFAWKPDLVDAHDLWDDCYVGERAKPYVLAKRYFGEAGTITVGLACYNENPWYKILGKSAGIGLGTLDGIYGAFNPYRHVEWTWAFSSAKAGYKFKGDDPDCRDYVVHWDGSEQSWNLCQSDWDAVFVPVRRAASVAENGGWSNTESAPLRNWVEKGDWNPVDPSKTPPSYVVSSMPDLPGMNDEAGSIDWDKLANMLYH